MPHKDKLRVFADLTSGSTGTTRTFSRQVALRSARAAMAQLWKNNFSATKQEFEMEHFLLALVLITADGPRQTTLEQPTLEECWKQAHAVIEKANTPKLDEAGVIGYGAGCIVVKGKTEGASR